MLLISLTAMAAGIAFGGGAALPLLLPMAVSLAGMLDAMAVLRPFDNDSRRRGFEVVLTDQSATDGVSAHGDTVSQIGGTRER